MKIETTSIREGRHIGSIVWVCHYNRPDLDKKPLRNVAPTEVIVRSIDDLPHSKTVYYSETFFSPIGKSGKPLSTIISPVDNTGYRSRHGNELHVFTGEAECKDAWNDQLAECIEMIDKQIAEAADFWIREKEGLESMKREREFK